MKPLRTAIILPLTAALVAGGYFFFLKKEPFVEGISVTQQQGLQKQSMYKSESLLYDQTWAYLLPYCKTYVNGDFIKRLHDESVPMKLRFDKAFDSTEIVLFSLFQGGARRVYFSEGQQWSSDMDPVKYKVIPEFYTHSLSGHSNELLYKAPRVPMAVGYYHLQGNRLSLVSGNGGGYTMNSEIRELPDNRARIKLNLGSNSVEFTGIDITSKKNGIQTRIEEIDHGFFVHLLDIIAREELGVQDSSPVQQYIDNFLQP
jgi:hypothetical protein